MKRYTIGTALLAAVTMAMIFGCTEKPAEPTFRNPLDPNGAYGGDPLEIIAVYLNGSVAVTWTKMDIPSITGYTILHKETPDGANTVVGEVESNKSSFFHEDFLPNRPNYYMVLAVDEDGNNTAASNIAEAFILPPPTLTIGDTNFTYTKAVALSIRTAAGDTVQIDSLSTFDSPALMTFALVDDDDTDELITATTTWPDLGDSETIDQWKHLYMRVFTAGIASATEHDSVMTAFAPVLALPFGGKKVGAVNPDLKITGQGIIGMRFATAAEELTGAFRDYELITTGPALDGTMDPQVIYGEFISSFGFSDTASIDVIPDSLTSVVVTINGGNEATSNMAVNINADVGATFMRYAQQDFIDPDWGWQKFEKNSFFDIVDPCATQPTIVIFSQFKNDWGISEIQEASFSWFPEDVQQVFFDIPDTLYSGQDVTLTGTATAGTCTEPLTEVKLFIQSVFYPVVGLEDWSLDWTVPTVSVATDLDITGVATSATGETSDTETVLILP
jgi:hypothetical protein